MDILTMIKGLSDENRLRILNLLKERELCGCELEGILGMTQSNVSRHLSKLTASKLTRFRKDAKYVYYALDADTLRQFPFLKALLEDLRQEPLYQGDLKKLDRYQRFGGSCDNIRDNVLLFIKS